MDVCVRALGLGLGRLFHCANYLVVTGAAAQVACQPVAYAVFARLRFVVKETLRRNQEARCAYSALEGGLFQERLLQGMEAFGRRHTLNRVDLFALGLCSEHEA